MFEHYDTLERPAHGWSVYLLEAGIIKQRMPGRYENRVDADSLASDYQERFQPQDPQRYEVFPYDEGTPR